MVGCNSRRHFIRSARSMINASTSSLDSGFGLTALAETYSVLTRLPGDARLSPADAAHLIAERFAAPLLLEPEVSRRLPEILAGLGIAGGAVYDAMVALAATERGCVLATRDGRARTTYESVGARVEIIG